MTKSMTGFSIAQITMPLLGKTNLEIRSLNHRFLEIVCNIPPGFSYLEDWLKKEIEKKIKRGRVIVNLNISTRPCSRVVINQGLIKDYFQALSKLKRQLSLKDTIGLDTLISLPGALSVQQTTEFNKKAQFTLAKLLHVALSRLDASRKKAGRALYLELSERIEILKDRLKTINTRASLVIAKKATTIDNLEERTSFLKTTDITEELTLLKFHLNNFKSKLNKSHPVGKELDFITQEMQREINTLAAKSFDAPVLSEAVEMKTQIEKVREQLQNVE